MESWIKKLSKWFCLKNSGIILKPELLLSSFKKIMGFEGGILASELNLPQIDGGEI